ncbi:MAG: adenylate/guanylate cyclase domain-containing protein [Candidatus Riflebacteria bacterium]|nr:adenylate/guanylate cyclase domain-containing protein [Candidatus Riflebacteria bacterium]
MNWRKAWEDGILQSRWEESVKRLAQNLSSRLTVESQIEAMGWNMTGLIRDRWSAASSKDQSELILNSFLNSFPVSHRPENSLVYAFCRKESGEIQNLHGQGLCNRKSRFMSDVFDVLLDSAQNSFSSTAERKKAQRLLRGVFGEDAMLDLFSSTRIGLSTPVTFENKRHLFYWNFFVTENAESIGYFILFPESIFNSDLPVTFALCNFLKHSRGNFVPCLVPFPQNTGTIASLPAISMIPEGMRSLWEAGRKYAEQNADIPPGQVVKQQDFWGMKTFFSYNIPLQAWVFSRAPVSGKLISNFIVACRWLMVATMFVFVFLTLFLQLLPRISLRFAFGFLFLMIVSGPLILLLFSGINYIDIQSRLRVQQESKNALEKLIYADNESTQIQVAFSQVARKLALSGDWLQKYCHSGSIDFPNLAAAAFDYFKKHGFELDSMHCFSPGQLGRYYPQNGIIGSQNKDKCDLFAPLIKVTHGFYAPEALPEEYPALDEFQNNWEAAAESMGMLSSRNFFLNTLENAEIIRLTGGQASFFLSQAFSDGGKVLAYFVYEASAEKVLRSKLLASLAALHVPGEAEFTAAEICPGGVRPIFPEGNSNNWAGNNGSIMKSVLKLSAQLKSDFSIQKDNFLYLAIPSKKAGNYVIGSRVSLSEIFIQVRRSLLLLFVFTGVMAIFLFTIGRLTLNHLIEPLTLVEKGLQKIAAGNLSFNLDIKRNDELGDMTIAFDEMVKDLRERKNLGKFVSGILDQNLQENEVEHAIKPRQQHGVILVTDIRSFTTLSETYPAHEIVEMLNQNIAALSVPIEKFKGRIDKFIGDAIVGIFTGAEITENLLNAVSAADEMMAAHAGLQESRRHAGQFSYEIGIGIDCGQIMLGTMGSQGRLDFSVVGLSRQVAEQMEALSKHGKHTRIILSPEAFALIKQQVDAVPVGSGEGFELVSRVRVMS